MKTLYQQFGYTLATAALAFSACAYAQQPSDCSKGPIPDKALELSVGADKLPTPALVGMRKISEMKSDGKSYEQFEVSVQDKDMFADTEASFSVIVPKGQQPDGKTFRKLPTADTKAQPSVEPGLPEVQSWKVEDKAHKLDASHVGLVASLRVEFDKRRGDVLPGRVYLCAPGGQTEKMFGTKLADPVTLVGRFEARIR